MELKRYMEKIYADSEEKFVTGIKLYFNSTDSILYYNYDSNSDTPYTNAVPKDELVDMFTKNLVMVDYLGGLVRPYILQVMDDYSVVGATIVDAEETAATILFYSDGYTTE